VTLVEQLPDLGGRPIKEFGWVGQQHLVTLSATTPTLLAFQQLAAAGVLGAPVVSPEGRLVANLSVSDVR
jgi:CBS domain-containing protein